MDGKLLYVLDKTFDSANDTTTNNSDSSYYN